ncbi:MAG: DUF3160 domain-containing protein [Lachnospiraceae bacterium]|nr:DUF3160 domain-containing protein [Lachnospiraceae bacterium]
MKIKRKLRQTAALILAFSMLGGCAVQKPEEEIDAGRTVQSADRASSAEQTEQDPGVPSETGEQQNAFYAGGRPQLIQDSVQNNTVSVTPGVEPYTVDADLGNVENLWQFYALRQNQEMADQLAKNGFVVCGNAGAEFFEIYENNRYEMIPNFVTVDSLMHTYHLYFAYLLKNIEKNNLADSVTALSRRMLDNSTVQYEQLKGSEWEEAAKRNVAFFTVGLKLLDDGAAVNSDVAEIVAYELDNINRAAGVATSQVSTEFEDYSQYIPRGYYEGDEQLERYFKAMMWYGRIHFTQEEEDMDRSALLITKALADDAEAYRLWESVYAVTSFFAGASDDLGVCEYAPVMREAYGDNFAVSGLAGNADAFLQFHDATAKLPAPQINSIPIWEGEENEIPGFRFMGQRFTIDAAVMQQLIYQNVQRNSAGEKRMLPDTLDVPAALGSDMALAILQENGAADYEGYTENMEKLREGLAQDNPTLWSASLYAGWLNTLRPLLEVKGEGYPMFMQNEEWTKKDLECFAGSYAELKHDTILYAKQVIAEMGGGLEEEPDDRGYVEPEPLVYERFAALSSQTAEGLKKYGMLTATDEENLSRLCGIAEQLLAISNKELQDEVLTDEEYELIRSYGGNIEHFWYETAKDMFGDEYFATPEYPAAIVADIATDPDKGLVLEVATGNPSELYVVVRVDGKIKVARGSVYSFYQFPWPSNDRLTDTKWRQMMGIQSDENGNYNYDKPVQRPDWTASYRYKYEWE